MARVYIEYLGNCIELPIGETLIGRDLGCMLRFNDPSVSRRHLRFIRRAHELFVEDLHSSNGTLLNGRRLTSAVHIHDGDMIVLGSRQLLIRIQTGPNEEPATLKLRELSEIDAQNQALHRRQTSVMPATLPPPFEPHQRCPACGAAVSVNDDECSTCHYEWGGFRPAHHTDVGPNPVAPRRHDRRPIELRVVYNSTELEIETTSRDLSESGVFVESELLDPVGTACRMTILIDGGPPLQIAGVVRRVVERGGDQRESGIGIEFTDVGPVELEWLQTTIARLEAQNTPES